MSLAHLDLPTLSRRRAERHDAAVREYDWLMDSMKDQRESLKKESTSTQDVVLSDKSP